MMADEILRVLIAVAPDVIGPKKTRRLLNTMYEHLALTTPANGIGPVIGRRRDAMQGLVSAVRGMDAE